MASVLPRNRLKAGHGACSCGEGSGRGRLARRFAAHGQPRERGYADRTSTDTRWTQRLASFCAGLSRGCPTALAPVRWPVPRAVVAAGVAVIVVAASAAGCGGPVDSEPRPPASPPPATQETPAAAGGNAGVLASPSAAEPSTPPATPVASASPTASPAISGAPPSPAVDPKASQSLARGDSSDPDTGRREPPVVDPKASQSLARGDSSDPDTGRREPDGGPPRQSKDEARAGATRGPAYTWQDGDRTARVFLATDLVVQDNDDTRAADEIVARGHSESIVRREPRHEGATAIDPVFRSQAGDLMTLPGGAILVFDEDWDRARVNQFFADHDIALSRVEARDYLPNAFFVTTEPGFPSLTLANALAGEDGVIISSPNWRTEVTTR